MLKDVEGLRPLGTAGSECLLKVPSQPCLHPGSPCNFNLAHSWALGEALNAGFRHSHSDSSARDVWTLTLLRLSALSP